MPSTPTGPARLVVLVSGSGTLLQALLDATLQEEIATDLKLTEVGTAKVNQKAA